MNNSNSDSAKPDGKWPTEEDRKKLAEIHKKANAGDRKAIEELREFLDRNPQVWRQLGDLTNAMARAWIEMIAGGDRLAGESILREFQRLKEDLVGANPTAIEKLLADQILGTMLEVRYLESLSSSPKGRKLTQEGLLLRRLESSQKRHLTALKSLAQMRRLMAGWESQPGLKIFGGQREMA